jgi:hypothetical protein
VVDRVAELPRRRMGGRRGRYRVHRLQEYAATRGVRPCSGFVRRNIIGASNRSDGGERCPSPSGCVRAEPS